MSGRHQFGIWLVLAALPLVVLLLLAWRGAVAPGIAALLGFTLLGWSALLMGIWSADARHLHAALLRGADQGTVLPDLLAELRLPQMAALGADVARLLRRMQEREALVGQLQRADESIVQRLPDPLLVLGADRAVRRTNTAARAAFGGEMSAVLRQPALRAAIDRAYAQGTTQSVDLSLAVPMPRELQASVIPLDPPLADGGRAVVLLSDRTRERAVERMRADFVANSSHELRTPLASLIGFIDTLRGPARDDPPAQARFLGIMAEQAERMNRLLDDLLSLSRIELNEHQAPLGAVDMHGLILRMMAELEPRVASRRITMAADIAPDLPPVRGDADQLVQVLQNLLDNAVKYGREGGTIRIAARQTGGANPPSSDGRWPARPGMLVSVADNGPGIAKMHLPRLTERFYRIDKGRSRAVGGTGLGLAIVKHVVNRHRGQMLVESEEGQGTTFTIWLPLAPPAPPGDLAVEPNAQAGSEPKAHAERA